MPSLKARSRNEQFGFAFGAIYVLVGIVGFVITGMDGFAKSSSPDEKLIIFTLNPLHNVVHLLVGGLFIAGALGGVARAKAVNMLIGSVYGAVGFIGLFLDGTASNYIAINDAGNALHFATALLALGVSLLLDRSAAPAASTDTLPSAGSTWTQAPEPEASLTVRAEAIRPVGGFIAGDEAKRSGTYKCSCGDFAVIVRAGGQLPDCPVGEAHTYRYITPKPAAATKAKASSAK